MQVCTAILAHRKGREKACDWGEADCVMREAVCRAREAFERGLGTAGTALLFSLDEEDLREM
jgi:hypothetical protein